MKQYTGVERRQYIRLESVFPVGFRVTGLDGKEAISEFHQGFTADVSKGGILLRVNNLKPELADRLERREAKLILDIEMPLGSRPVRAVSKVAWMACVKEEERDLCILGLAFEDIAEADMKRLVRYASSLYRAPKMMALVLLLILIVLAKGRMSEVRLARENAILVARLADVLQRRAVIVKLLDETTSERDRLLEKLDMRRGDIADIEKQRAVLLKKEEELKSGVEDVDTLKRELDRSRNTRAVLESQLKRLSLGRNILREELNNVVRRKDEHLKELDEIEETRRDLEAATVGNMYNWLRVHQNRRTGLVASYEGDSSMKDTAFIYDQSLVSLSFLLGGDAEGAGRILDFFKSKAKRHKGAFANAYAADNGAITEYAVHCGPNIWLGIAFTQYAHATGDREYLKGAAEIADWVIDMQDREPDGGICGGPGITWFSTEHNLDAHAFFKMLAEETGSEKYTDAAARSLEWIRTNAYTGDDGRIRRGRGDSTIATDTFAWAVAAIGPRALIESGMDPDAIMEFAEDNCRVTVDFKRPDGDVVEVTGFDFAKETNLARGGIVSSEWTAQMVVSFKIMGEFYSGRGDEKKAAFYKEKAHFYINELEKMVITSPSRSGQGAGCLPYATEDDVETGHGWRTPRGRDTGSVSGTAYTIFAIEGYNPLKLKKDD